MYILKDTKHNIKCPVVLTYHFYFSKQMRLLTTIHNHHTYVEGNKTEANMFYNKAKGGVDAFDLMCSNATTNRKTRRWPYCVFLGMINIIHTNSWIVYRHSPFRVKGYKRTQFLQDMAYQLCRPWVKERWETSSARFSLELKESMRLVFKIDKQVCIGIIIIKYTLKFISNFVSVCL